MKAKYLIVTYENYGDYEEHLIPIKICEDYTLEDTDDCEVFEINEDGTIGDCVKGYEEYSDEGFVLCDYMPANEIDGTVYLSDIKVIDKVFCKTREEFKKTKQFEEWKKYFKDEEDFEYYETDILNGGSFSGNYEDDNEHWYVVISYHGNKVSSPY